MGLTTQDLVEDLIREAHLLKTVGYATDLVDILQVIVQDVKEQVEWWSRTLPKIATDAKGPANNLRIPVRFVEDVDICLDSREICLILAQHKYSVGNVMVEAEDLRMIVQVVMAEGLF